MATGRSFTKRIADAVRAFRGAEQLKGRSYKGAEWSRLYSDWIASLLSPHDEIRGDLRTLRARARELSRNNGYAGQFLELVTNNVIGPDGQAMRAKARDRKGNLDRTTNDEIEGAWLEWRESSVTADGTMSFVELQELALETAAREGEQFTRRIIGRDFPHGISLQLIDPDLVDDLYTVQGAGLPIQIYLGIEVDILGRRQAYHVLDMMNYSSSFASRGRIRIPASEVIHAFRAKRANQMRGVTWLARAMAPLWDQQRYDQNELVASAAGAAKMGFITNEVGGIGAVTVDPVNGTGPGDGSSSAASPGRVHADAEPASIWELEPGQNFVGWTPNHPSTAYAAFTQAVLQRTASALGVTYESLSMDLSKVTYLSARAGLLIERAAWRKLQKWWIRVFLQPVFDWWLESAFLTGRLRLPGGDWRAYRNVLWKPRGWDWIDPQKDASAYRELLDLKLTTRSRIAAGHGDDFEEILEELAEEEELGEEFGIDLTVLPRGITLPPQVAAAVDEEPEAGTGSDVNPGDDASGLGEADGSGGNASGNGSAARAARGRALDRLLLGMANGTGRRRSRERS